MAAGSSPTGVITENRPPTLSGSVKIFEHPSVTARCLNGLSAPVITASDSATSTASPSFASSADRKTRNAIAVSMVLPDLLVTNNRHRWSVMWARRSSRATRELLSRLSPSK
ncbi:MAG: hypothetical protein CM1200mP2_42620 [Planctomycetaceae bacterium]|nr:MAG: hypothetical protein CM1200mP2_42620 [Planctomycetaceae bacterium]